jgi:precorrin-3B methylase
MTMAISAPHAIRALSEAEIENAISVADAALAVAGRQGSEFSRDVIRRGLSGKLTDAEVIELPARNATDSR